MGAWLPQKVLSVGAPRKLGVHFRECQRVPGWKGFQGAEQRGTEGPAAGSLGSIVSPLEQCCWEGHCGVSVQEAWAACSHPFSIVAPRGWVGLPGAQVGARDLALSLASLMTHNWLVLQCRLGRPGEHAPSCWLLLLYLGVDSGDLPVPLACPRDAILFYPCSGPDL